MTQFMDGDFPHDFNCFPGAFSSDPSQQTLIGGRGVTIWGPLTNDIYLPANGGTSSLLRFTGTKPRCYLGSDNCLVTFTLHTEQSSANTPEVIMRLYNLSDYSATQSTCYHSTEAGHDVTSTIDIVPGNFVGFYNDTGPNALYFINNSNVDVWVKGLQIVRVYYITYLDQQGPSCSPDQTQTGDYDFTTRTDYACNPEGCGGASYTGFNYDNHVGAILQPGTNGYQWTWTNPPGTFNGYNTYEGPLHCLINFNNVNLCDSNGNDLDSTLVDVPFWVRINTSNWVTLYQCKLANKHLGHSFDLATYPYLKDFYNDNPGATNTLYLYVPNNPNPNANLHLNDGGDGRINLYRVYKTKSICLPPCGSCQVACQDCQGSCQSCQSGEGCPFCYGCLVCESVCELCQDTCQLACQTGCEVSCQSGCEVCTVGCEVSCEVCQTCVGCQQIQNCPPGWYTCQGCETCQPCNSCNSTCQISCQACEICQGGCQVCVSCQQLQNCPPGWYTCQGCETCQPGYT